MQRYMPDWWVLPAINDQNREFFTSGEIKIQQCEACGQVQHPPEEVCHQCQGIVFDWRSCSGEGTIFSHTVVEHPIPNSLQERVPYAVILVSLTDYPAIRIIGNATNIDADKVAVGQKVRAVFEVIEDEQAKVTLKIPQWEVIS
ncbi:MAG: OB-fold domain-containing protein [Pseudomonadales bacterium]|nr:OB-fold domain-containing protein [Pseudomonadales bacterium]